MASEVLHVPEHSRFVIRLPEWEAILHYRRVDDSTLDFHSTLVPPERRSEGVGRKLVEGALSWARDNDHRVIPSCPFVASVADASTEWDEVVAESAGSLPSQGQGKVPEEGPA